MVAGMGDKMASGASKLRGGAGTGVMGGVRKGAANLLGKGAARFGAGRAATAAGVMGAGAAGAPVTMGTSVLIAGAVALAIEIPGIVEAFTDKMPDLLKSIERSTEVHKGYIKAIDGVLKVQGQLIQSAGQLSKADEERLQHQLAGEVAQLDPETRKKYSDLMGQGKGMEARSVLLSNKMTQEARVRANETAKGVAGWGGEVEGMDSILDSGFKQNDLTWKKDGIAAALDIFDYVGMGGENLSEEAKGKIQAQYKAVMGFTTKGGGTLDERMRQAGKFQTD